MPSIGHKRGRGQIGRGAQIWTGTLEGSGPVGRCTPGNPIAMKRATNGYVYISERAWIRKVCAVHHDDYQLVLWKLRTRLDRTIVTRKYVQYALLCNDVAYSQTSRLMCSLVQLSTILLYSELLMYMDNYTRYLLMVPSIIRYLLIEGLHASVIQSREIHVNEPMQSFPKFLLTYVNPQNPAAGLNFGDLNPIAAAIGMQLGPHACTCCTYNPGHHHRKWMALGSINVYVPSCYG